MLMTYTGTPGSGKSYHCVKDIIFYLKSGGVVITNLELDFDNILKYHKKLTRQDLDERLIILVNEEITPKLLFKLSQNCEYLADNCKILLLIDEAADLFNTRDWQQADRKAWLKFFRMHRHLKYNVILVAQSRRMIDKQIQWLFDTDVQHRNLKNFGLIGALIGILLPKLFIAVDVYVPLNTKSSSSLVFLLRKYYTLYDTHTLINYSNVDFFGGEDIENTD